jgi:hypothetical protein
MRSHRYGKYRLLLAQAARRGRSARNFSWLRVIKGGAEIELAVERGEVQCRAFTIQVFFGREPFNTWRSKNLVRVLVYAGKQRDPRLPDTPLLNELMDQYKTSETNRRLVSVMLGSGEFGSAPMFGSPGTHQTS